MTLLGQRRSFRSENTNALRALAIEATTALLPIPACLKLDVKEEYLTLSVR